MKQSWPISGNQQCEGRGGATAAALVDCVIELEKSNERGAAHKFLVSYEESHLGESAERAREHYRRALELSGGVRASVFLAPAGSVTTKKQNLLEFEALTAAALAADADRVPNLRLGNTISKERALRLRSRIPELFWEVDIGEEPK